MIHVTTVAVSLELSTLGFVPSSGGRYRLRKSEQWSHDKRAPHLTVKGLRYASAGSVAIALLLVAVLAGCAVQGKEYDSPNQVSNGVPRCRRRLS